MSFFSNIASVEFTGIKRRSEFSIENENSSLINKGTFDENEIYKDHEFLKLFQEVSLLRNYYSNIKKR